MSISIEIVEEIGETNGLTGRQLFDFIGYIKLRNFHDIAYIDEWAIRFKKHQEFYASDLEGQKILIYINPLFYTDYK